MSVSLLSTSYPVPSNPVSGIFVARLANKLKESVSLLVITPSPLGGTDFEEKEKVRAFRYAPKKWQVLAHQPGGIPIALQRHKWSKFLLPFFLMSMTFSCLVSCRNSDLIHANWTICGFIAGIIGRILRIPVLTTIRGEDINRAQNKWFDRLLLRFTLILNHNVVSINNEFRQWICDTFPAQCSKVYTIENGVDDAFMECGENRSYSLTNDTLRLITVGSLIERKGIDVIIEALSKLNCQHKITLTIVGDGPELKPLKNLCRTHNLDQNISFEGRINPCDLPEILRDHDVFVLGSHAEGRPNAVLEAMAAALPIIATDIPGTNEIIHNGTTGLLFTDGKSGELAEHIKLLVLNRELRKKLGANARDYIESNQLLWSNTAHKYRQLYNTVVYQPDTT